MVELNAPRPLQDERTGTMDSTAQGRYSHVAQTMQGRLIEDVTDV